jgi:antirestriction protein ArdC
LENPFFLTFKQVEKLKGKVKKGSVGHEVVYFTRLYTYSQKEPALSFGTYDKKKFEKWFESNKNQIPKSQHNLDHSLPILKYYKVFNGKNIEGIDFDLDNFKIGYIENELPPNVPMPIADAIVENFPKPQVPIKHGGDKAAYYPGLDYITMPHKADFETAQDYYRTLFHELGHSTGANNRLNRDFSGRFGSKKYAFEELIAELNAVFVSAEAGFMWHTNKNHAGYLKGWNSVLTQIEDDNRFVMRAASQAQKAADFILQPDKEGNPAYLKSLKVDNGKKKKTTAGTSKKDIAGATEKKAVVAKAEKKSTHRFTKGQTVQVSKRWGKTKAGAEGTVKELRKSAHGDPMYSVTIGKDLLFFPETVLQLPKKKLTKEELEKANPEPKAVKPKSVSVQTAVSDILRLDKYNFKEVSPLKANLIFNLFKNVDLTEGETAVDNASDYAIGVLKNDGPFHNYYDSSQEIDLTTLGVEFVDAVKRRLETLRNQKHNYALFDGLNGTKSKKNVLRNRKTVIKKTKSGLKSPTIEPKPTEGGPSYSGESPRPLISGKHPKVRSIKHQAEKNPMFAINGETSRFLQAVEKKPIGSVVVTLDGPQGAGKTTALYKFQNDFAEAGNRCLFASLEEHPSSNLASDKKDAYLSPAAQENIDTVGSFSSYAEFCEIANHYDCIFIDSWQKLVRMIGAIRLDEDVRKQFNGKVFFVIFQQTTEGRTKGGAEIVFDGDIIIKMEKFASFADNYAYFDKNRYTTVPIETIKYMIAAGKTIIEGETGSSTSQNSGIPALPQNEVLASTAENEEKINFKVY